MNDNEEKSNDLLDILEKLGLKATIIDGSDPNSLDKMKDILKGKLNHDCNLENPSKIYPSISLEEGKMYIDILNKVGMNGLLFSKCEILDWSKYIGHTLTHIEEFIPIIMKLKEIIHIVNRTSAIMTAIDIGVVIGLFLGRPDLVPMLDIEDKEEEIKEDEV